ncbi:MAG: ferrochelatase [Rickettsiaceae bacterium H1]|nr:ferrochelatase [Rickettsiaceae bacterium H1]
MSRKAVLLFNLGGPDSVSAIKPFLFNLFNDKCIINLPQPFRYLLAKYISYKRFNTAKEIYSFLGGKSPILEETEKQAQKLEISLGKGYKVFIAMRYWKPFIGETLAKIDDYNPEELILLPLYPQYSTTTTLSSFKSCLKSIKYPVRTICCYYNNSNFIESHTNLVIKNYSEAKKFSKPRILFSAHGLPLDIIKKGDPYQWQVNVTAGLIVERAGINNLDWKVCYQSKVGRKKWLEPSTETEIKRAVKDKVPLVIVPIAFVSEHSETLVELDIEYKKSAEGIEYFRVPTLSEDENFINTLSEMCKEKVRIKPCPKQYKMCWQKCLNL